MAVHPLTLPPPGGSPVDEFERQALRKGLAPDRARRLAQLVGALQAAQARDSMTITELKRNPGQVLAKLFEEGPQKVGDGKRKGQPEALLVPVEDIAFLVDLMVETMTPRYATGVDLYTRFAHGGAPHPVVLDPPAEPPYRTPSLEQALAIGDGGRITSSEDRTVSRDPVSALRTTTPQPRPVRGGGGGGWGDDRWGKMAAGPVHYHHPPNPGDDDAGSIG